VYIGTDGDRSVGRYTVEQLQWYLFILELERIIWYVVTVLGIPGNILSAIVWIRRHLASQSPSPLYLAALAINDLLYLLLRLAGRRICKTLTYDDVVCRCLLYTYRSASYLEPLLVLSFSVARLIAIRRPLQVCCITRF